MSLLGQVFYFIFGLLVLLIFKTDAGPQFIVIEIFTKASIVTRFVKIYN